MRQMYLYFEAKRLKSAELELEHLAKYLRTRMTAPIRSGRFLAIHLRRPRRPGRVRPPVRQPPATVPIYGLAEGKDARGGSNVAGNEVRNLALNGDAYTYHLRSYPRVTSNSHYCYRPEFSPSHAIDGERQPGIYWRPARRTDTWLMVEFGREVEAQRVVITLHQNDGQEKTWTGATLEFSNGEKVAMELKNTAEPQEFTFPKQRCAWVKLIEFREQFPLGTNGIVDSKSTAETCD